MTRSRSSHECGFVGSKLFINDGHPRPDSPCPGHGPDLRPDLAVPPSFRTPEYRVPRVPCNYPPPDPTAKGSLSPHTQSNETPHDQTNTLFKVNLTESSLLALPELTGSLPDLRLRISTTTLTPDTGSINTRLVEEGLKSASKSRTYDAGRGENAGVYTVTSSTILSVPESRDTRKTTLSTLSVSA